MSHSKQPKDFIKSLQIIHISLLACVLVFSAYVVFTLNDQLFFTYKQDQAYLYLAIMIAFSGNLCSKFLYAKLLKQISWESTFNKKMLKFTTAHIFRIAMLTFTALLCVIFVLYSNNSFYFILAGILTFMLLVLFPTKAIFKKDIPLSIKEKSML